jgi:hypothetical protein
VGIDGDGRFVKEMLYLFCDVRKCRALKDVVFAAHVVFGSGGEDRKGGGFMLSKGLHHEYVTGGNGRFR